MLRNRRLVTAQPVYDLANGMLSRCKKNQNLPPPRLRYGIERIGGSRRSGHVSKYIPIWEYVKQILPSSEMKAFAVPVLVDYDSAV